MGIKYHPVNCERFPDEADCFPCRRCCRGRRIPHANAAIRTPRGCDKPETEDGLVAWPLRRILLDASVAVSGAVAV
eukprot:CAMPEP_0114489714 /NCGR_PEP_ID=MMETSP0109-20121206/2040_1 /TAXON_ID=29199 /ORGANISM="Chlorarachnion reptans, Strain CCCM449" /LENGTH=75 /DNA_ID=CAMNT_0001666251 /DNA_START=513 /DNA_END=740 /DNA_ORIENTATION=+